MSSKEAKQWDTVGRRMAKEGDLEAAADAFQRAVEEDPKYVAAWRNLAVIRSKLEDNAGALMVLQEAFMLDQNDANTLYDIGLLFGKLENTAKALDTLEWVVKLGPDHWKAWKSLGDARTLQQDVAGGIKAYEKSIELNAQNPPAWYFLGLALEQSGQLPEAAWCFRQSTELGFPDGLIKQNELQGQGVEATNPGFLR